MPDSRTLFDALSQRAPRPSEEEERRALQWLMDVWENGDFVLERRNAATVIATLAWFESRVSEQPRPTPCYICGAEIRDGEEFWFRDGKSWCHLHQPIWSRP